MEADDALTAAIEANCRAYHDDCGESLLHDYMVIYARTGWNDDGSTTDVVGYHPRDGDLPFYREFGLVAYVNARMQGQIGHATALDD